MLVLLIVLVVTNLVTLALLAWLYLMPIDLPRADPTASAALDRTPRPGTLIGNGTRRLISIEILNPIELAGTKGRLAGIAGSLVPSLTRRLVHDQTLKILRQQLIDQQVIADVRLHTVRPIREHPVVTKATPTSSSSASSSSKPKTPVDPAAEYTDEIVKVDLDQVPDESV